MEKQNLTPVLSYIKGFYGSHPKQYNYITENALWNTAYGSRRAGKTFANVCKALYLISKSYEQTFMKRIVFASATIEKTKSLYWRLFLGINQKFNLGFDFYSGKNMIRAGRYCEIHFRGLRDIPSANLDYGFPVLAVFFDEVHTVREIVTRHYLNNVIEPTSIGVKYASINLIYNPPPVKIPYIEENLNNKEIERIKLTIHENPAYTSREIKDYLLKMAKRRGYKSIQEAYENDPGFRRDMFGEFAYDTSSLVFQTSKIKTYEKLPEDVSKYEKVIGVDTGGGMAKDAIVVICYSNHHRTAYVDYEVELSSVDADTEDLAAKIKSVREEYNKGSEPHPIAFDYGGHGKRLANIIRNRHGIHGIIAAKKTDKMAHLLEMRTEAYRGRLLFKKDSLLLQEMDRIFFNDLYTGIDEDNSIHSDLLDACLYAVRWVINQYPSPRDTRTEAEKDLQKVIEETREMQRREGIY